jgi:hypothetical protein
MSVKRAEQCEERKKHTGSAVDQLANLRVVVELAQELASLLIVADLSELEGNGAGTVLRVVGLLEGVANSVEDGRGGLASGLSISDGNDEQRLAHLSATQLGYENAINDLLAQFGTHGGKAAELVTADELLDLLLRLNVLDHVLGRGIVHEAEGNAVVVEESGSGSDTLHDELKILDALAILFELHRATVVNVEHDIIQGKLDNVVANLLVDAPLLAQTVNLSRGSLRDLVDDGRVGRVEGLEALLLDCLQERLLVGLNLGGASRLRGGSAVSALRTALLRRVLTLTLLRWVAALLLWGRCTVAAGLLLLRRLALL